MHLKKYNAYQGIQIRIETQIQRSLRKLGRTNNGRTCIREWMTCRLRGNGHGKSTLTCFLRKYPKVRQNIQTLVNVYILRFSFCQIIQIFQQTLNDRYHLWTRIQLKSCVTIHLTHYGISPQESQYCISGSLKRNLTEENISKPPRTHTQLMPNVYLKDFFPLVMNCGYWLSIIFFLTCLWLVVFLLKVKSWFLILCYR